MYIMKKLKTDNFLFENLKNETSSWWLNLIKDKQIYIDIRKDNSIDVYHNGGSIIKQLKHNGVKYYGEIHYKYLLPPKKDYMKYDFTLLKSNNGNLPLTTVNLKELSINLMSLDDFEVKNLNRIKQNIKQYYPATSEKGIQGNFIVNLGQFLDSEFAYTLNKQLLRIDLVWIDVKNKIILPIELKTIGDSRLFTNEIYEQLKKYNEFLIKYEIELIEYYQKIFQIKKELNILPQHLKTLDSLSGVTLETKPLLLFGDCQQNWIKINSKDIDTKIKSVACGAYYFGKPEHNCDLIPKTKNNRHIF